MILQQYSNEQLDLARNFISPDAFFYIVADAISSKKKLSAVGFGDGERAIMLDSKVPYLKNSAYLKEYGLIGADMNKIRSNLWLAAKQSDWVCPLISGVSMPVYDCIRIAERRYQYVERLFPYAWYYMQREKEIMKCDGIAVVCRNSVDVSLRLTAKYGKRVWAIEYSSWRDQESAFNGIVNSEAKLILCAVSQSGKMMIVNAANETGKVVLDIGSALINKWQE